MPDQPTDTTPLSPPSAPVVPSGEPPLHELDAEEREYLATFPPASRLAWEAFRRDLPRLLRDHPRLWVAYTSSGQVGEPHRSKAALYQRCLAQGLKEEDFFVHLVEPLAAHLLLDTEV
jgi:hypothetical protein